MSVISQIFDAMPASYQPGKVARPTSYYFSIGDEKYTAICHPDKVEVTAGRTISTADCVLKCDPKLFEKMVLEGKMPGPIDIARGKIKTSSVDLLKQLPVLFKMGR